MFQYSSDPATTYVRSVYHESAAAEAVHAHAAAQLQQQQHQMTKCHWLEAPASAAHGLRLSRSSIGASAAAADGSGAATSQIVGGPLTFETYLHAPK